MIETQTIALEATYKDGVATGYQKTAESIVTSSKKAREGLDELSKGFKGTEEAVKKAQDSSRAYAQLQAETAANRVRATKSGFDQERALAQLEHSRRLAEFRGNNKLMAAEMERHQSSLTLIARKESDERVRVQAAEAEKARAGSFGGQIGSRLAGVTLAAAGFLALSQAQQFIGSSLGSARESIEVQTELAATLRSTGFAAGVTQEQLNEQAEALQRVTRFSDETIGKSQAMLLTFTRIGKEVLPEATESTLDLAQKFGGDATQAAVMLGKALNDPIAGITNLSRVGVQLSNAQEAQIKQFMRQGNILAAQKVILAEVQVQTGGLARSMGDQDPFTRFANTMDGIKESLGGAVLPVLADTAEAAIKFVESFRNADGLGDFFKRLSAEAGKDFSKSLPDADKLKAALTSYRDLNAQVQAMSKDASNFGPYGYGPIYILGKQLQEAKATIQEIAGDEKAKTFLQDIDKSIADLTSTVTTLEDRQKAAMSRKQQVDVDPSVLKEREAAAKREKEILREMSIFEANEDFKREKKAIEEEKRKEREARRNQALEEEYQKGKTEFADKLSLMNESRLEQELKGNKKHYDALRKEAAEWFTTEEELQKARTEIERAESAARMAIFTQLAQGQLATVTSNLQAMAARWKVFGTAYKVAAHAQNVVDTYASATASYRSLASIPFVGPILGGAAAAAAIGAGLARGAVIQAQKFTMGGLVEGGYSVGDRIPAFLNAGELVLNRTQQSRLFSMLNGGMASPGAMSQRNSWQITYAPNYTFSGGGSAPMDVLRFLKTQPAAFGDWFMKDVVGRGYAKMAA
jgi:hypothetical protein